MKRLGRLSLRVRLTLLFLLLTSAAWGIASSVPYPAVVVRPPPERDEF